jgi:hypothetical protein
MPIHAVAKAPGLGIVMNGRFIIMEIIPNA